ncbi:MAG: TetR/AcrR family transcriptional regulator [Kofleriaceae bacterium]|nr:MAG: TetR/AcrR family transcriptional regulator [Kofleriaceae bacterium]MBZ0237102.1 TetR family transcriptional regulator [Kofleriaceae bacterium]
MSTPTTEKERSMFERIFDVAIALAEEGGYDNVRQRDVAARAGVALGTLYKRFRSKEDILSAALARETERLERKLEKGPVKGDTAEDRLVAFYSLLTRALVRRPHFARAVLRAMASGQPEVARHVVAYQGRMNGLIIAALRGVGSLSYGDAAAAPPTEREQTLALLLQQNWFASLIGWSAGLHAHTDIIEHVRTAARLYLKAMDMEAKEQSRASRAAAAASR